MRYLKFALCALLLIMGLAAIPQESQADFRRGFLAPRRASFRRADALLDEIARQRALRAISRHRDNTLLRLQLESLRRQDALGLGLGGCR